MNEEDVNVMAEEVDDSESDSSIKDEGVTTRDVTQTDAAIENVFEFIRNDDYMFATVSQRRIITKILKLAEKYPDEVTIEARPETNDGYLVAKMPVSYLHISNSKRTMTDEQKKAAGERMRKMHQERKNNANVTGEMHVSDTSAGVVTPPTEGIDSTDLQIEVTEATVHLM